MAIWARLVSGARDGSHSTETVSLIRGDEWVAENSTAITKIDFIKNDVEGHESKVIHGLKQALFKFRPIIMLEYSEQSSVTIFRNDGIFETYLNDCEMFVLGGNYDPACYGGKPFVSIKRILAKKLKKKTAKLYCFNAVHP
ncbi:hypothetical protein D3C81_1523550 [compost metagenome]